MNKYGFKIDKVIYLYLTEKNILEPPLFIMENAELVIDINTGLLLKNILNEKVNLQEWRTNFKGLKI